MGEYRDLTGERFGQLRVLGRAGSMLAGPTWHCLCACGEVTVKLGCRLKSGAAWACHNADCSKFDKKRKRMAKAPKMPDVLPAGVVIAPRTNSLGRRVGVNLSPHYRSVEIPDKIHREIKVLARNLNTCFGTVLLDALRAGIDQLKPQPVGTAAMQ